MNRYAAIMAKTSLLGMAIGCSGAALAQDSRNEDEGDRERAIIVTGTVENPLVEETPTGSRLNLTPLETPASVYSLDGDAIRALGDTDFMDAVTRAPGLAQSQTPGNGSIDLTSRGFGGSSVLQLFNGVRLLPNNGSLTFPFDTWNVERIEVLTGPGSVLYGQGALGGVINVIPKSANFERGEIEGEFRYGSFDTRQAAVGLSAPITELLAFRADASLRASDGYVDRGYSESVALSGSLEFRPTDDLSFVVRHDYGNQKPMNYWGTPLADGTLDTSIRERNYNVKDAVLQYKDNRTQMSLDWAASDALSFNATAFHLTSRRHWENVESYSYDVGAGEVQRADHLGIIHDSEQTGGQAHIKLDTPLGGGIANQLVVGTDINVFKLEYSHNNFPSDPDAVDPHNFDPGFFSTSEELKPRYRARTETWAIYAEDRIEIGDRFSIIAGARYEKDTVKRFNYVYDATGEAIVGENPAFTGGSREFEDFTWRVGAVYQPTPSLSIFGQYATGVDPLGTLTTPSTSPSQVTFTNARGDMIEGGVKATFLDGAGWATVSAYRIVKNDLAVQRTAGGPIEQIGQQSSQGIEAALSINLPAGFGMDLNGTVLDAEFEDYPGFTGNTPPGVPQQTANATLRYTFGQIQARGTARYVGKRNSNNANDIVMPSYLLLDAGMSYAVSDQVAVDLRVFNLLDEDYVIDNYGSQQWILGRPRAFEVGVRTSF
jgi:iron complex outermembrane receptor protein